MAYITQYCKNCCNTNRSYARRFACRYCGEAFPEAISAKLAPITQKSRGLKALLDLAQSHSSALPIYDLIPADSEWDGTMSGESKEKLKSGLFARPCPPSPEHGFVESRVVKSIEEIKQVLKETKEATPGSEVMLTPLVKASMNMLWTPNLLTVGPGHDGATAGKDTVSIPLVGKCVIPPHILQDGGIAAGKDPYIEAVRGKAPWLGTGNDYTILTQMRSGPKLEGISPDFIPSKVEVKEVVQTNGEDLLAWAKRVKQIKEIPGTVVWHPGGSLTDHYSVHCRENSVPIMLTREPIVGETLEELPTPPLDPEALIAGLAVGDILIMADPGGKEGNGTETAKSFTALSLLALHNSVVLRGDYSFWIGVGTAAILKLGSAAMSGEARHAHNAWNGYKNKDNRDHVFSLKQLGSLLVDNLKGRDVIEERSRHDHREEIERDDQEVLDRGLVDSGRGLLEMPVSQSKKRRHFAEVPTFTNRDRVGFCPHEFNFLQGSVIDAVVEPHGAFVAGTYFRIVDDH